MTSFVMGLTGKLTNRQQTNSRSVNSRTGSSSSWSAWSRSHCGSTPSGMIKGKVQSIRLWPTTNGHTQPRFAV